MREDQLYRIPSGCAVVGILNQNGLRITGDTIIRSISVMHDRSNGLGGGFAGYGIYPDFPDLYAFHLLYDDRQAILLAEDIIENACEVEFSEDIPFHVTKEIQNFPYLKRYFLNPKRKNLSADDEVVQLVMKINSSVTGAYVISSGKNMGIFKGVGYPEDIGRFFRLEEYEAYCWISHGRFPTNSVGWWGGAHPFGLLSWSVVHNGEISSYGINRRYLQNFDYHCNLQTDTEVITYLVDLLGRKHQIRIPYLGSVLASPFWHDIDLMPEPERTFYRSLRVIYGGALLNGPFSIIVGFEQGMFGLVDRIKLRPMIAAWKDSTFYLSSEESAIREIAPDLDEIRPLQAGEVVSGQVGEKISYGKKCLVSRV
ncbi:MAG: glutamine amidotransferase family protein [Candidatus Atribacteria bacterium]|nr:glutamine amidotransferase family protein [Candidatus Atribacteria bacterium]